MCDGCYLARIEMEASSLLMPNPKKHRNEVMCLLWGVVVVVVVRVFVLGKQIGKQQHFLLNILACVKS